MADASSTTTLIEPCLPSHLPHILSIYNHYIQHTPATFDTEPATLSSLRETYDATLEQGLPYLVAVPPSNFAGDACPVVGFAYAKPLRPRPAYAGSVEITIYIHPTCRGQGHGKQLLSALLRELRKVPKTPRREHGVREILTVSAIDPENDVRGFYAKNSFVEVGRLRDVGWKFGRWWDTSYGQLSLREAGD